MSFVSTIIGTAERVPLPDVIIRAAIQRLCSRTATRLASGNAESDASFADEMAARAIAEYTDAANAQHYEVPAAFFAHVLGPNRKYSSCFYKEPASTLQEAEEEALRQTVEHADLADGQSILELGCGWGSLSLWMARQFPHAQITAVSNSHFAARIHRERGRDARLEQSARHHRGHERVRPGAAVRPHRLGRNVRAHDELARIDDAGALMAEAGRPLLHAHLHPSLRRLSVRPRRRRGLDRAAFLHRRRDAEPSSDPAICRSVRGREGMALERHALPAHRARLARQFRSAPRRDRRACCATSMATTPACGCGAGAGSSSPPQACSATPTAANGASAITG